jgi:hypothetical protein
MPDLPDPRTRLITEVAIAIAKFRGRLTIGDADLAEARHLVAAVLTERRIPIIDGKFDPEALIA